MGFKIRSELAKVIMYKEEGDLSLIYKVIRTVNYLNRLLVKGDQEENVLLKRGQKL